MISSNQTAGSSHFMTMGRRVDFLVGVAGALMGAFFGRSIFASIGIQYYGIWAVILTAAAGAFSTLFFANIIHLVSKSSRQ